MFKTTAEYKAAEAKALEGLTGKARKEAQTAFYNANKTAIRAVLNADAVAKQQAAQSKANTDVSAAAAEKGLEAFLIANVGLVKGSSYDELVAVHGNTFACKDILKAHGAQWNTAKKCWLFKSKDAFLAALSEI